MKNEKNWNKKFLNFFHPRYSLGHPKMHIGSFFQKSLHILEYLLFGVREFWKVKPLFEKNHCDLASAILKNCLVFWLKISAFIFKNIRTTLKEVALSFYSIYRLSQLPYAIPTLIQRLCLALKPWTWIGFVAFPEKSFTI